MATPTEQQQPPGGLDPLIRTLVAGIAAWLVPGAGHVLIGQRGRGLICMATIAATFWGGVALAGTRETVNPDKRKLWFSAQVCTGAHAGVATMISKALRSADAAAERVVVPPPYMSVEIGIVYTGVAGLLNLLVIMDCLVRSDAAARQGEPVAVSPKRGPP